MQNPNDRISLAEYIAQANRTNNFLGVFGPDFLQKQTFMGVGGLGADSTQVSGDIFTTTFGRKVWQALNNQVRFFNALPKVVWGNTAGWRVRTDRGNNRSGPIGEAGPLPTIDVSNIATVSSLPRIVGTTFGVTLQASFIGQLEGGAGDIMALEMQNSQTDHIKEINQELLAASGSAVTGGAGTTVTVPSQMANAFRIGDTLRVNDGGAAYLASAPVTAISTAGNVFTVDFSATPAATDSVFVNSRLGFTSMDDIIQHDGAVAGTSGPGGRSAQVRAYDLGTRTADTWNAMAHDGWNAAGAGRALTLRLLDTAILNVRVHGGEPKLIVMGHDQYYRLEQLLQSQQRYLGYEEYQVGVGGEKTFPGTRGGMMLATYQGIPILPEVDSPRTTNTNGTVNGSTIYVLDTDYIEVAMARPTQYIENRDFFAANAPVLRGLFYTLGELRVRNIWVQAALRDLQE